MKRLLLVVGLVGTGLGGVGIGWESAARYGERMTTSRLSPDETLRASLIERPAEDRRFQIRVENLVTGESSIVFRSPDEGQPYGTERLIWSTDGTKLLLVGRHFFVKEDLFLNIGDQAFFLHDVPTGRGWCNSEAPVPFPPLKAEMIEGVEFIEPVRLKNR